METTLHTPAPESCASATASAEPTLRAQILSRLLAQAEQTLRAFEAQEPPQTAQQATHCARALLALSRLFNVLLPPVDDEAPLEMAFPASLTRKPSVAASVPVVPNRQMRRKAEALARRG